MFADALPIWMNSADMFCLNEFQYIRTIYKEHSPSLWLDRIALWKISDFMKWFYVSRKQEAKAAIELDEILYIFSFVWTGPISGTNIDLIIFSIIYNPKKISLSCDSIASFNFNLFWICCLSIKCFFSRPRRRSGSSIVVLGGDSIEDYINSDNIDHFHRLNDGTYRETPNDLEMLTMMSINQDNGKFSMHKRIRTAARNFRFSHFHQLVNGTHATKKCGQTFWIIANIRSNGKALNGTWQPIQLCFSFQWQRQKTFRSSYLVREVISQQVSQQFIRWKCCSSVLFM